MNLQSPKLPWQDTNKLHEAEVMLRRMRENPDLVESAVIKRELLELIIKVMEWVKKDSDWMSVLLPLLQLNIIENTDIKDAYMELLGTAIEQVKANSALVNTVLVLFQLNIVENIEIKDKYLKVLDIMIDQAKQYYDLAEDVVPALLQLDILWKEDKVYYMKLLDIAIEESKNNCTWAEYIVPALLEMNILWKEDKVYYMQLLDIALEQTNRDYTWVEYVIPVLLQLNILWKENKVYYMQLLDIALEESKTNSTWAENIIPVLLQLNILWKEDKVYYMQLLDIALEESKNNSAWAEYIVPSLLQLNIVGHTEIKDKYINLLDIVLEQAKRYSYWAECVVPVLLQLNILWKEDKIYYMQLLDLAIEEAKRSSYWAEYIVPALLQLNIIEYIDIKDKYRDQYINLLNVAVEKAQKHADWRKNVVPTLLQLNILWKEDKVYYMQLLDLAIEEAKDNYDWAMFVVPALLQLNIVEHTEIKDRYINLLDIALEKSNQNYDWENFPALLQLNILWKEDKVYYVQLLNAVLQMIRKRSNWWKNIVPALLELDILWKEDKVYYKQLLNTAIEEAKKSSHWAEYIVPALLQLNILWKEDKIYYMQLLNIILDEAKTFPMNSRWKTAFVQHIVPAILQMKVITIDDQDVRNIPIKNFKHLWRYECCWDKSIPEDIVFFEKLSLICNKKEQNKLLTCDYEIFAALRNGIEEWDYQSVWKIKSQFYPTEEKEKLVHLQEYFGEWVWTYFFDKVSRHKNIVDRFRDPHNALLHRDQLIALAKQLETKGIHKEQFINAYLGVAWDRANWYQQLNDFLIQYDAQWEEDVKAELADPEWLQEKEFLDYANSILQQGQDGSLYKNLDSLEKIVALMQMLYKKDSLKKLQVLSESKDERDQKRYEYFKSAIYHPRTTLIIMDLYEDPEEFLWLNDTTFPDLKDIHETKKPVHMVQDFPYLDFDAKDLVDCLSLWVYDAVSYFKPYEKEYLINANSCYAVEEVQTKVQQTLMGADQKKISVIITAYNKIYPENLLSFWQWKENRELFIQETINKNDVFVWIDLFTRLWYQEFNQYKNLQLMTAKITAKADPNNWFNWFNCDALSEWHGKKVVAMFNPYCTDFCIYQWEASTKNDTLKVTSRVTLNRQIPHNFNTLLEKVKTETTHDIVKILWTGFNDVKDPKEYIITMDNIEANANFWNKYNAAIRMIYEDFFSEYVGKYPLSPAWIPINTDYFQSGINYNKLDILTKRVPNETLPVFVNWYTDNGSTETLIWELHAWEKHNYDKKRWIQNLSIEDVIPISYLEWNVYPESMKAHLWNLQHEITASVLNNTLKWRENLSFTWYDEEGKLRWYLLAYQGNMQDGEPWIYISDFAIDEHARWRSWVAMITHWIKVVKEKYPQLPIFTRARANTSYRLVQALAEKNGYIITQNKKQHDGGEDFHSVIMKPKFVT